ncbi:hypothetical protein LPB86_19980 [Pedobacter sp. MC2016-14]|uniref:PKD-like family lipoprotein n=1 Tax=Pedobacter sp. MC2016-14 TaxID=2897327 RepID=UPI001E481403|nr:PKD-like family lipoprotein [Pedobacter sp. MC2016-14]MCD0490529.1 hypothetical protein [Pedobacter sp. MC2016-14]
MNTILKYCMLAFCAGTLFSCSKDLGNYEYHEINKVTFSGLDTIAGYTAYFGDSVIIAPNVEETIKSNTPASQYRYEWSFDLDNNQTPDSIISTSKVLRIKVGVAPGSYGLQYRVKDLNTGVQRHIKTTLRVVTEVYEGFMVLNDVNGKSRLDMLSYSKAQNSFTQFTDVLTKMGSHLPEQGKPLQVFCTETALSSGGNVDAYHIYLLSETGTNRIHSETFDYLPTYNIRYEMIGALPANFKPQLIVGGVQFIFMNLFMVANDNLYIRAYISSSAWPYVPVNTYSAGQAPFPVAPFVATNGIATVMYNKSARRFVISSSNTSVTMSNVPDASNYPTGNDMLYMERNYSGNAHAVLKNPVTSKISILRFTVGGAALYYDEIMGTDIDKATHYAVSPDLGYLFYSVGGKVYEYDLSLKTSKLMVDKGTGEITYLAFQNFYNRNIAAYANFAKQLTVGSFNSAGVAASSGTLERYTVPPVNGDLVLVDRRTGFGKITSVSYRERTR